MNEWFETMVPSGERCSGCGDDIWLVAGSADDGDVAVTCACGTSLALA